MKSKGEAGEHLCTNPPYGYRKDPDNRKRWIVDGEAAEVVKRIFALCLDGYGPSQIARILKEDKVITPTIHFQQTGRATRNAPPDNPYNWTGDTIADILERPEYQGHTVNFKTYKQSYKSKKTCYNPEEKWLVFENTHEAIIDADTWARVQELRKTNDARRGQERQICFPALCAVPIAAKSCITAQARTLKQDKTILFALLQGSRGKRFALLILSAPLSWNRAYSLT